MHIRGADSRLEQAEELTSLKIGPLRENVHPEEQKEKKQRKMNGILETCRTSSTPT